MLYITIFYILLINIYQFLHPVNSQKPAVWRAFVNGALARYFKYLFHRSRP